jgi:hypothetical protein
MTSSLALGFHMARENNAQSSPEFWASPHESHQHAKAARRLQAVVSGAAPPSEDQRLPRRGEVGAHFSTASSGFLETRPREKTRRSRKLGKGCAFLRVPFS